MVRNLLVATASLWALAGAVVAQTPTAPSTPLSGSEIIQCLQSGDWKGCTPVNILANSTGVEATGTTTSRSLPARFAEVANVLDYGADPTGNTSSTTAFNNALASGALAVYVPPGTYSVCGISMPSTFYLQFYGAGTGSQLVAPSGCNSEMFFWTQSSIVYSEQSIHDLYLDGTHENNYMIDTTGVGGLTIRNVYINNLPNSHSFSGIYVNGVSPNPTHDVRIINLQVYTAVGQAAFAAVRFGPLAADSLLQNMIMNGNYGPEYGVYIDNGATTIQMVANHPYNAANSVLYINGCNACQSIGDVWDNSTSGPVVYVNNSSDTIFTGDLIESINTAQDGIQINSSSGTTIYNTIFNTYLTETAASAVAETSSDYTQVVGGGIGNVNKYTTLFSLTGTHSFYKAIPGSMSQVGLTWSFSGSTTTTLSTGGAGYDLGINGQVTYSGSSPFSYFKTAYSVPYTGYLTQCIVVADVAPAASQSYVLTLWDGTTEFGTAIIASGAFTATITPTLTTGFVNPQDPIHIEAAIGTGSSTPNLRYNCNFIG